MAILRYFGRILAVGWPFLAYYQARFAPVAGVLPTYGPRTVSDPLPSGLTRSGTWFGATFSLICGVWNTIWALKRRKNGIFDHIAPMYSLEFECNSLKYLTKMRYFDFLQNQNFRPHDCATFQPEKTNISGRFSRLRWKIQLKKAIFSHFSPIRPI